MRRGGLAGLAWLIVMAMTLACGGGGGATPTPVGTSTNASPEWEAPELELVDLEGEPVRLSTTAGQLRLVDFWATWCPPCVEEMPMFKELHESYADRGLVILGLSADDPEDVDEVRAFLDEHGIPWTNALAPPETQQAWKVSGLPQTYLVDADGIVVKQFPAGPVPKRVLVEWIEKLLPESGSVGAAGV